MKKKDNNAYIYFLLNTKFISVNTRTPEPNQKGTVLGGPNWKIEGKWAENNKNQSIFEGQGGPGPPRPTHFRRP